MIRTVGAVKELNSPDGLRGGNFFVDKSRKLVSKCLQKNYPTKTCEQKHGFRYFDVVKAHNRNRGMVIGSVKSLKANVITVRTVFDDNFAGAYKKSHLVYRFSTPVYNLKEP